MASLVADHTVRRPVALCVPLLKHSVGLFTVVLLQLLHIPLCHLVLDSLGLSPQLLGLTRVDLLGDVFSTNSVLAI